MSTHHGILLHVVFSTKYRFPCLGEHWRNELFAYIGGTARDHQAMVLASSGSEDHIHLLMKVHPKFAISSTMQLIKANSSRWINEQQKVPAKFSWQRGYGAFSVSESLTEAVTQYIQFQKEHHRRMTFREEYLRILRRHRIEFDERFVFEEEIVA